MYQVKITGTPKISTMRRGAILVALEESKRGEFISHEAVEKWVASIGTNHEHPMPKPDVFASP